MEYIYRQPPLIGRDESMNLWPTATNIWPNVTNWCSTGGPGLKDYFESKNTDIQHYLGAKIILFLISDELWPTAANIRLKVTNWYSTGGPGLNDYFESKNSKIEQYLGVKIIFNRFIQKDPPFHGANKGGKSIHKIYFFVQILMHLNLL